MIGVAQDSPAPRETSDASAHLSAALLRCHPPAPSTTPPLLAVGRLVRACAELDDIVLLHLCVISGRPEAEVRTWLRGTTDRLDTAKAAARKLGMAFVFGDESLLRRGN